ncbi:hypothetical protein [Streptomyces halobius]|uniref:Uncharacterized protein n=1 Tax=Streptomyces halobius TaxID=2879846 RepID=A0ABY4M399_9ACTN|nr:hypothetical protein [Streptomyces halobius]UQA91663.1 hypothetical protein K9S39_07110 [Streptomyces halobius]
MTDTENRQMLPEVAAYIEARDKAEETYKAAGKEIGAKYSAAFGGLDYHSEESKEQRKAHRQERDAAWEQRHIAINEAWNAMKQSSDPLVRFIAEHCKEYQGEAIEALKALPATADELDELAEDWNWCRIWDQFRAQAVEAGVFPGVTPLSAARKAVLEWADNYISLSRSNRRKINQLLDDLVAEAKGEKSSEAAA